MRGPPRFHTATRDRDDRPAAPREAPVCRLGCGQRPYPRILAFSASNSASVSAPESFRAASLVSCSIGSGAGASGARSVLWFLGWCLSGRWVNGRVRGSSTCLQGPPRRGSAPPSSLASSPAGSPGSSQRRPLPKALLTQLSDALDGVRTRPARAKGRIETAWRRHPCLSRKRRWSLLQSRLVVDASDFRTHPCAPRTRAPVSSNWNIVRNLRRLDIESLDDP